MTKAELIERITERLHAKKKDIFPIVKEVFAVIEDALVQGEKCTIADFGVFDVKDRAAREGRNPQNPSQIVKIPAKKAPIFRAGKGLKEKVRAAKIKKKK